MIDTIIKGSGNSRGIRSVPNLRTLAPTWEKALDLLESEDGMPIDLLGPNPLGCEVVGTPLNAKFLGNLGHVEYGTLSGSTSAHTIYFSRKPVAVFLTSISDDGHRRFFFQAIRGLDYKFGMGENWTSSGGWTTSFMVYSVTWGDREFKYSQPYSYQMKTAYFAICEADEETKE